MALEPFVSRARAETALTLLVGPRSNAVEEALAVGLIRLAGDSLDLVDATLGRVAVACASEQQLRWTHLALAGIDPLTPARTSSEHSVVESVDAPWLRTHPGLTVQETAVAELAATGAPTSEIARLVRLSPKTVEFHLTRVYRKIGVRSKAELAYRFRLATEAAKP